MSSSSTIHVSGLAKETLHTLRAQAEAAGVTVDAYTRQLLEEVVALAREARTTSFDELFSPVQLRFQKNGMNEAELDKLVTAARRRHHRKNTRKKS